MPDDPDGAGARSAHPRDAAYMRRALTLARRGWGQTAPNPLVGAVLVRDEQVVGEGYHARYGGPHAEIEALRAAGARAAGATLYVSLEPCAHHGKTPPCADAILAAGVRRVVAAVEDPSPTAGGGAARLRAAGMSVELGVLRAAALELNRPFFHALTADRPWITLKLAVSLDCGVGGGRPIGRWLTGTRARAQVHRLRAGSDAVAVGIGTAIADDPALTVRGVRPPRVPPLRVVFDRGARLSVASYLARTAHETPTLVLATDPPAERVSALRAAGVDVVTSNGLDDAVRWLRTRGVRSLLVEGGPRLAAGLLEAGLVDRLIIFQAPLFLGAGRLGAFDAVAPPAATRLGRLQVLSRRVFGDDLMTVFAPAEG